MRPSCGSISRAFVAILVVAVSFAAPRSAFAAGGTRDERVKTRKAARRGREAVRQASARKDMLRDSWRIDRKLSATDRISDAKLTDQKYLSGQMRRERTELKEDDETARKLSARDQARKARSARQQRAAKAVRTDARRKKRIRAF